MSKTDKAALATAGKSSWRNHKKIHPVCELCPPMESDKLRELADDIAANEMQHDVLTCAGDDGVLYILDGKNRLDACELLGWQLVDQKGEWHGKIMAHVKYLGRLSEKRIITVIKSVNLHRNHYTESQRAMVAAGLANMTRGNPAFSKSANLPNRQDQEPVSQAQAAKMFDVSERSVRTAKKVLDEAPAKIVKAVKSGTLAVSKALQSIKPKREKKPREPIPPEPVYTGPVSQLQVNGEVQHTVEWWAAECNLAQAHLNIARDGLRLAKGKAHK
jgi:hypothetical protein